VSRHVRAPRAFGAPPFYLTRCAAPAAPQPGRPGRRRVRAAAARGDGGDGGQGGATQRAQAASQPTSEAEAGAQSSLADVAAALGLDPSELESDGDSPGDIADGVVGADAEDGLLASPFAPLLGAVTEEITARWRSAIAGRWSPNSVKPLGPSTPYAYLERKLRPEDAERYAAAGVLPFLWEDGLQEGALASLGGGMELIVGGPASLAAGAPQLPAGKEPSPGGGKRSHGGPLGNTFVLLARQGPGKKRGRRHLEKLQLLGGKREGSDAGPLATALREIQEETGGLLNATSVRRELLGPVLWVPQGRFVLFLYSMKAHQRQTLPSAFLRRASAPEVKGEVASLDWVPLVELLTKARALRQGIAPFARHVVISPHLLRHFVAHAGKEKQAAQTAQAAEEAKAAAEKAKVARETRKKAVPPLEKETQQQQQARTEAEARRAAQARLAAQARRVARALEALEAPVPRAPPAAVVARSVNDVAELLKLAPTAPADLHSMMPPQAAHGAAALTPLPAQNASPAPGGRSEPFGAGRPRACYWLAGRSRWRPPKRPAAARARRLL